VQCYKFGAMWKGGRARGIDIDVKLAQASEDGMRKAQREVVGMRGGT